MVKIAAQTYSLFRECSEDLEGTLRTLRQIGFQSVEPPLQPFLSPGIQSDESGRLWSPETLAAAGGYLRELGMNISSVHVGINFGMYALPIELIRTNILALHDTYGITDFVASGAFSTVEKVEHWAKLAQDVSDAIRPYGCRLLYHNHDDEFRLIRDNGIEKEAIEAFLNKTSDDVLLQVDIGWAAMTTDLLAFLRKHKDRVGSLHLKDFYSGYQCYSRAEMPTEIFAPIGEGVIPTNEVLSMLDSFQNFGGTVIIDQDKSGDGLRDMEIGYQNIRRMLSEGEKNG